MDKLNELLSQLQGNLTRIPPQAGADVASHFVTKIHDLNRPELEPIRRELVNLQLLLEGRTPGGLSGVGVGQQLIVLGRLLKTIPAGEDGALASTLGYLAATLENQGRSLVGDLELATAPDARFAVAESNVVGPADSANATPGNPYASLRGV